MALVRVLVQLLARRAARYAAPTMAAASRVEARTIAALTAALDDRLSRLSLRQPMSVQARMIAVERAVDHWLDRQEHRLRRLPAQVSEGMQVLRSARPEHYANVVRSAAAEASTAAQVLAQRAGLQAPGRPMLVSLAILSAAGLSLAAFAPVERVAVGDGVVTDEGQSLALSHPEGGFIESISVFAGQEVRAGDLLFRLEPSAVGGNIDALRLRAARLAMTRARLNALMDGADDPAFSSDADLDPRRAASERAQFRAQKARLSRSLTLLDRRADAARARIESAQRHAESLRSALARNAQPEGFGVVLKADLSASRIRAQLAMAYRAQESAREALAQAETERTEKLTLQRREWALELERVAAELAELDGALLRIADRSADFEVRAPAGGRVQWIASAAPGVRVQPGQALVAILPSDAEVIAEVWTPATQARQVRTGDPARVMIEGPGLGRGQRLDGIVKALGPEPPSAFEEQAYRRVLVALNPSDDAMGEGLKAAQPGVGVRAEIIVSQAPGFVRFAGLLPGAAMARDFSEPSEED